MPGPDTHGYAQALVGVDGAWRGIRVQATDREQAVIEYEPEMDVMT